MSKVHHTTTESESESSTESNVCPECSETLIQNPSKGETVCSGCGLVIDADQIDPGPEWREFDDGGEENKSRVGAPLTNQQHDQGLSTTIDWKDKDAYGNSLNQRQRRKMNRLRWWDKRFRTRNSKKRTLKHALGEIDRMGSALGLPDNARETASVLFRRTLENDLLPGRSIEGVATACVYAAGRQAGIPRSLDELAEVSHVERNEFMKAYRYITRELELELEPPRPEDYIQRYISDLDLSQDLETRARELLECGREEGVNTGKNPVGLAAAAIYAASLFLGKDITQAEITDATDVSQVTIRTRYQELLEADPEHPY